jgi:hypothetical protein
MRILLQPNNKGRGSWEKNNRPYFLPRKFISLITLFFLFLNQTLPIQADVPLISPYEDQENQETPTQPADRTAGDSDS